MKKYFFTAAALLIAASCTRELPENATLQNENLVPFTIENANGPVIAPEDGSRTQLGNLTGSVVNWTAGDNALLFDNISGCKGHKFTGTPQSDATKINFAGEVDETSTEYWVLYPYNSSASKSGSVISTTLSATQTAVAGSFADKTAISFAHGTRTPGQEVVDGLSFSNLCSVIAITIPTYVDNAKSVVITANSGTAMTGTISFNTDGSLNSVSGSSSVTLSGTLSAGATYFAVVAPKEYANGFTLTLTTAGNNTYSASTTKTINAQPGMIYPLGTLGVKLNVTPTVTIAHTYSGSTLTGSSATLSIPVPSELAAMISAWNIELLNSGNTVVRRYDGPSGTMVKANGYDYLPQGTYTISGTYTTQDGKVRTLAGNTATSPAPTFSVSVSGYTSYNYGVGADGYSKNVNTANGLDGSTIYGLGASVTISVDLMNDVKYSKSFTYSYDGGGAVSISGNSTSIPNKSGQSWAKHSLSASCTFDGVAKNASRDLHVTGLPWTTSTFNDSTWDKASWNVELGGSYVKLGGVSGSGKCNVTSKTTFYIPANINIKTTVNGALKSYKPLIGCIQTTFNMKIADTQVISQKSSSSNTSSEESFSLTCSDKGTFTSSNCQVYMESTYTAAGPYAKVTMVKLEYR